MPIVFNNLANYAREGASLASKILDLVFIKDYLVTCNIGEWGVLFATTSLPSDFFSPVGEPTHVNNIAILGITVGWGNSIQVVHVSERL